MISLRQLLPKVGSSNDSTREAWLKNVLANVPAGSRLLDAGAGTQRYKAFCTHLKYVSQDFAQYDGKGDARGLQAGEKLVNLDIVSDITAIPEPDSSFDALLCVEVLEHVPDPLLALREFARLVKPGGELILTAPFCSLTHLAPYHFASGFSRYFYEHHLPKTGFEIRELVSNGNFFEFIAQELRRTRYVAQRYSKGLNPLQIAAVVATLAVFGQLAKHDHESSELLCFGYQVRATRKQS